MAELQRGATSTSIIDVLDHILDKGIVIDAWMRVSLVGIDLLTVEARVVVASIDTYVSRAEAVHMVPAITPVNFAPVWHPPPTNTTGARGSVAATLRTRKR
jgi:hypothetical protein